MDYLKDNWRWIVLPIVVVLLLACAMVVLTDRDGLDPHRYDLGYATQQKG